MTTRSAFNAIGHWRRNMRGTTAMMFALVLLPLLCLAGFAIDNSRHSNRQNKVQHALDFAALAVARESLVNKRSDTEIQAMAQDFFDSELDLTGVVQLDAVIAKREDDEVSLSVQGSMPTGIMSIIGRKTLPVHAVSVAAFGDPSRAEIALVLDTSYSMTGTRHLALTKAANDFIDMLIDPKSDAVRASIVPFADYVNVGTGHKGESWLDVELDRTDRWTSCSAPSGWHKKNCTWSTYKCTRDGIASTCGRWECGGKTPPKVCKPASSKKTWHGCVKSRSDPLNIQDKSYATKRVEGFVTGSSWPCPSPIVPLTNDAKALKSAVAKLAIKNETYIPTGLSWGMRTLSSHEPFSEGTEAASFAASGGRKAIVLMSDGANTKAPSGNGMHTRNDEAAANKITRAACNEIKANGIELYTIAFEITDTTTKDMLRECASSTANYFDASDALKLQAAFANIGENFREIAIAR